MSEVFALIGAGLRADAEVLRTVADNVANFGSGAYRRQIAVAHVDFDALLAEQQVAPTQATAIDETPGTLRPTGEPLDLALDGPGYFVVATDDGEALTRSGDIRLDAAGRMVTARGDALLGERGAITVDGPVSVAQDGVVRVRDEVVDRLRIAVPGGPGGLAMRPDGLYALTDAVAMVDGQTSGIRQGFLETSNVSVVTEMTLLMDVVRHFESLQRIARGYDGMLDKAISELGKV